ncbi:membrane fusion protein, multidrug efflux system [Tistlia consotensis]|uniref:Membrane fusion protein, multidrug efflux system n=1 Tax=Tistlia consotensis USBA 355 TaxID=560819 RepID=A0A1Y6BA68_9PROT|nr:efflux RND transporter periplasmic adaptor subunit [Tistlia consotensis]SME89738.1 membrane fusion protein, multidrug efflux system [Tistlia consotensis USBA 355]SNR26264.1 membrane fusion protein, multidrug efflux system [Tistlia consotensis]
MRRVIIFVVVFVLLAALVGGFAYFQFVMKPKMIQQIISSQQPPATAIAVEVAKTESWRPSLPAIGTFEAIQGIDLSTEVSGIVKAIHFDSGQEVKQGALLVELDTSTEQAELKSAEAQLKKSQADLKRQSELVQRGNTSRTNYDAAVADRDSNAAEVERIRAVIDQKVVLAPFTGRLGIRKVDIGQFISAGDALVTLQQLDPIYVDFPMPEQDIARLAIGQDVEVKVDAFSDKSFSGKVASIDARVNQETRNILIRGQVPNPDRRLLPGMFANVNVLEDKARDVVTVPRTAITYSLYGDSVFVVKEPEGGAGKAGPGSVVELERRSVTVGAVRGDRIVVTEGVKAGERVVTGGQNKLYPGQKVKISDKPALEAPAQTPRL